MIDRSNTNKEDNSSFQSAWQMVSQQISSEDLSRPQIKETPSLPDKQNPASDQVLQPASAQGDANLFEIEPGNGSPTSQDPYLKKLMQEISAHESHDKTRSYLARAFDVVYSPDSKTLKDLKALSNQYTDAIRRGDTGASEQMKLTIEEKIKEDMKAVLNKSQVDQLASNFTKTMFLFIKGTIGVSGTIAAYSLDQMKPESSVTQQLIDGSTGAVKGVVLRAILQNVGRVDLPVAAKGVALGVSSRLLELGLNPQTYFDPENNKYDMSKGLSTTFLSSLNPKAMMTDAVIFAAAHGLTTGLFANAPELIQKSPFLSTVSTAYVFGATSGALNELNRQQNSGENFDITSIALSGARDGAISALAASLGGLQSELAWRKTNEYLFIKEGENGQFSFAKTKYYEVKASKVTKPEGELVKTLENQKGELAPKDAWIIERSPKERYPIKQAEFDLRWQPVPGKPGVFSPRPVPTSMVELSKAVDIKTQWGNMHGNAGDFLVRYGKDNFAIVARKVMPETYAGSNLQSTSKLEAIKAELSTKAG